jgi:hypothetical protein
MKRLIKRISIITAGLILLSFSLTFSAVQTDANKFEIQRESKFKDVFAERPGRSASGVIPGGDPTTGPATGQDAPVGDALWIMLALCLVYGYKK